MDTRFVYRIWRFLRFPFLFFSTARILGDKRLLFMNSNSIFLIFQLLFINMWVSCTVHEIHKLHFLAIFSLKIGFTALFTHLKIILLQYFQFQKNKFYPCTFSLKGKEKQVFFYQKKTIYTL